MKIKIPESYEEYLLLSEKDKLRLMKQESKSKSKSKMVVGLTRDEWKNVPN